MPAEFSNNVIYNECRVSSLLETDRAGCAFFLPGEVLVVLSQSNPIVIRRCNRDIVNNALVNTLPFNAFLGIMTGGQNFVQSAQANDVLPDRAVIHFGLLKQILLESNNIKIRGVAIKRDLAAKTAQCGKFFSQPPPHFFVNKLIHFSNRLFIDNLALKHQSHSVELFPTL